MYCCALHTYQYMLYMVVDCNCVQNVVHYKYQKLSYLVAIVLTATGSATASFLRTSNVAQENSTANILIKDQLQPLLDRVAVNQAGERTAKPNSRTKRVIRCANYQHHFRQFFVFPFCFTGLRKGEVVNVYWNIWNLMLKLWREDYLFASCVWERNKTNFFRFRFATLAKYSKHVWSLFGANIG